MGSSGCWGHVNVTNMKRKWLKGVNKISSTPYSWVITHLTTPINAQHVWTWILTAREDPHTAGANHSPPGVIPQDGQFSWLLSIGDEPHLMSQWLSIHTKLAVQNVYWCLPIFNARTSIVASSLMHFVGFFLGAKLEELGMDGYFHLLICSIIKYIYRQLEYELEDSPRSFNSR